MLHIQKSENLHVKTLYYHLSLKLGRPEPNQCIILSCYALLLPCPIKSLSWACPKVILHIYCSSTHALAQPRILICQTRPESALVLPCTELNLELLAITFTQCRYPLLVTLLLGAISHLPGRRIPHSSVPSWVFDTLLAIRCTLPS